MRILIRITYCGTAFSGWQIQPSLHTVEGELTQAVMHITGEKTPVIGSGRTDTGVHAICQCAHFDLNKPFDIKKIPAALNFYLPSDIRVLSAKHVSTNFHARKSAKSKTYIYKMYISNIENPLLKNRELRINKVNINLMQECARLFEGEHDFAAYMSSGSSIKSTIRTVYECKITKRGSQIRLKITANGFLYNMVRKITAALVAVGEGKKAPLSIKESLANPNSFSKETAPAHGLYLLKVKY